MPGDAIDLLLDWQDEREADREEEDAQPQPDTRSRTWGEGRPRKPWPPREITDEELASGPTRKCNRCERVYPETGDFFRRKNRSGRIYLEPTCIGCTRSYLRRHHRHVVERQTDPLVGRWRSMRGGAKARGYEWGFNTPKDLREFLDTPCHYCGGEVKSRIALDRVDNDKGYIPGNVVQCCLTCNRMKMSHSVDEWVAHMRKVLEHLES